MRVSPCPPPYNLVYEWRSQWCLLLTILTMEEWRPGGWNSALKKTKIFSVANLPSSPMTQMAMPLKTGRSIPIIDICFKEKAKFVSYTSHWILIFGFDHSVNHNTEHSHAINAFTFLSWGNLHGEKCWIRGFESGGGLINPATVKLLKVERTPNKASLLTYWIAIWHSVDGQWDSDEPGFDCSLLPCLTCMIYCLE